MSKAFNPPEGLFKIVVIEDPVTNPKSNNLLRIFPFTI